MYTYIYIYIHIHTYIITFQNDFMNIVLCPTRDYMKVRTYVMNMLLPKSVVGCVYRVYTGVSAPPTDTDYVAYYELVCSGWCCGQTNEIGTNI